MQSGSLRTARALVFALALTTLVAIAYLSNRDWQDYAQSRTEGQAASQAMRLNERLLGRVRDAETGQRGYLLTGRAEYLQPYHQAIAGIPTDLEQLRVSQVRHPQQVARVSRLEGLVSEKLSELRMAIDVRYANGAAAALAIVESGRGKQLMDDIRVLSQQIETAADEQLAVSRNSVQRHTAQARLVTVIGCTLLLAILIIAFAANERSSQQRENLIAELAKANRASVEVRDLLRTTFYSIADGVITTDAAGRVQLMNSMAERLTGFTESEASGKAVEEIFQTAAQGSRPAPGNPVRSALNEEPSHGASNKASVAPMRLRAKSGTECFVEARATAIRHEAGALRGAVLVFRDVTERIQSEDRMRQTAKLESLGVLAGGIAHDFNNILVGILGNASLLEEHFPPGSPGRDLVDTLQAAGERAARLTSQMLAYSGRGKFVVQPVDLSKEVEEIASLVRASVPKNVELRLVTNRGLPTLDADSSQLQQLIMNLIINGAEAVGEGGGYVEVTTSLERVAEQSVTDVLGEEVTAGRYLVLSVKDSGRGMDEATRTRIFDPFFTTKFTGRGLGLAAALGIVKGHGGAIEVQSAPGQGATFHVYFPASQMAGFEMDSATRARKPPGVEPGKAALP
ncbi:MAG: CHASE3 domain-containing protein [Bryobacteraceae bacterium]